jgi:4-hydroxy-tetrahydrodipicolinate synthase
MNRRIADIKGSLVALATPFRHTQIDESALSLMCERQIQRGTTGLVVCGSTGEAATLSDAEQARAIRIVVESACGRVPVIAGCSAAATARSVELATAARRAGADGLLCTAPPYVKPTQDGVIGHLRSVAHAADLPVLLYDVPGRVGIGIADATVARLFEQDLIAGIKDATADLSRPPRLALLCGEQLLQLTGDDATQGGYRAMGGHGCISVTANIAPALCALLHSAWEAGNLAEFARLRDRLDPLHAALFSETNPIPLKAALAMLKLCTDAVRLPLTPATPQTIERLRRVLRELSALEEASVPYQRHPGVNARASA